MDLQNNKFLINPRKKPRLKKKFKKIQKNSKNRTKYKTFNYPPIAPIIIPSYQKQKETQEDAEEKKKKEKTIKTQQPIAKVSDSIDYLKTLAELESVSPLSNIYNKEIEQQLEQDKISKINTEHEKSKTVGLAMGGILTVAGLGVGVAVATGAIPILWIVGAIIGTAIGVILLAYNSGSGKKIPQTTINEKKEHILSKEKEKTVEIQPNLNQKQDKSIDIEQKLNKNNHSTDKPEKLYHTKIQAIEEKNNRIKNNYNKLTI